MGIETWKWTQKQDMGPSPRAAFSMVYDSSSKKIVLFGGIDFVGPLNDTWEWEDEIWTQVADMEPTSRVGHSMAYNSNSKKIVLFGGSKDTDFFNDTWEWDGTEWSQVADTGPSVRAYHSMAYDSSEKAVILFGGHEFFSPSATVFSDTWKFKSHIWTNESNMGPPPTAWAEWTYG